MKKITLLILIAIPFTLYSQMMNVISFNIRLNIASDGKDAWPNRVDMVTGLLRFHQADIIGLQEALYDQIEDIQKELPEYSWIGVGREDGKVVGEFSAIFYKKSEFTLLNTGTFWLSETPEEPSKGWDAAFNRVVTWGQFESIHFGERFYVFNTHFDHVGIEARINSAELIKNKIQEMTNNFNDPVILTGDFNLTPDTEPIKQLKETFNDSREVSVDAPYGPVGTFNGFKLETDLSTKRIDYVFVSNKIKVVKYAVVTDFLYQRFPSDHFPVFTAIQFK